MQVVGAKPLFPPCNITPHNFIPQFSHKFSQNLLSIRSNKPTHFGFWAIRGKIRSGSCVFGTKNSRNSVDSDLEVEGFDSDEDGDDDDDDDDDEFVEEDDEFEEVDYEFDEDDEDEEDMIVPMGNMKKWLENKPLGFGEGKEYDTSIEDKLAEEMEQSRLAQLANLNKLKNNTTGSNNSKNQQKQKASEVVSSGIRVRLVNLPKKKNITRDLQQAFKGAPGMINIVPLESGNKKTREPICTGIAFVYFKSEDDANRFIQNFSRQSIAFGKIQKQIKYEMMNSTSPKPSSEKLAGSTHGPRLAYNSAKNDLNASSEISNLNAKSKDLMLRKNDNKDAHISPPGVKTKKSVEAFTTIDFSKDDYMMMPYEESPTNALSSQQQKKNRVKTKKIVVKRKQEMAPKLNTLGSANRLKIKEKAVLTDVFSKYGQKMNVVVQEQG